MVRYPWCCLVRTSRTETANAQSNAAVTGIPCPVKTGKSIICCCPRNVKRHRRSLRNARRLRYKLSQPMLIARLLSYKLIESEAVEYDLNQRTAVRKFTRANRAGVYPKRAGWRAGKTLNGNFG